MNDVKGSFGLLVIRIFTGLGIAAHGAQKLFVYGPAGTAAGLGKLGIPFPGVAVWPLIGAELLGGLLLAAGFLTRPAAAALAFTMLVAAFAGHWSGGYFAPAGMEYPLTLAAVYAGLLLLGPGRYSIDARRAGTRS